MQTPAGENSPEPSHLNRNVRLFWEAEACGERYGRDQARTRYELEPEILSFANFPASAEKRVLEVGVGMGADFLRWKRASAQVVGVDLTARALQLTRKAVDVDGLSADVALADAEQLPFASNSFDIVYSWGVLHHTSTTERAIRETQRVLAPGGQLKVMLYHRRSWVALAAWARFGLLRGRPTINVGEAVAHIESPGTKAFTVQEGLAMLTGMDHISVRPCLSHWDRRLAPGVARVLGDRFGWFLLMEASKPIR